MKVPVRQRVRRTLMAGFLLALALTACLSFAVLVVPVYDMQLYDRVLQSRSMDTLALLSVFCLLGLGLHAALEYLRSACFVAIGEAVGRQLHGPVLDEGIRRAAAGDTRAGPELVRDLNELQGFLTSGAVAVPLDALCVPLFLAILFLLHPAFGWLAVAGVSALLLLGLLADGLVRPGLLRAQDERAAAGAGLSRALAEPEVAEGLGLLPALARRWAVRHGHALAGLDRAGARATALGGVSRFLRLLLQGGVIVLGAVLVLAGGATPGSLMGATLLLGRVLAPFDSLVNSWRSWATAHASWRRVDALLSLPAALSVSRAEARTGLVLDTLALHTADGRVLLDGVTVHVPPGTLAVVAGPNGAGKTTLLRLIAGVVPPTRGVVLMDGAPPAMLPGGVGWMPQGVSLLDGTLAENVGRFRDGSLDDTVAASRRAGLHEVVGRMAAGYGTPLGANGSGLSGGMKQRVGLARALLGAPRLMVLDEPDASLDAEGAQALLQALRGCCDAGGVVVVTSHRPALRDAASLLLTLEGGRLVEAMAKAPPPRLAATARLAAIA